MWRGMLTLNLVAITSAVLGVFLYLRRMSLIADALAHVALPGIVVAFLVTQSLHGGVMLAGAALMGLLTAAAIEWVSRRPTVRSDAAIGVVFTALFALGVILLSTRVRDAHIDTHCLLYGDVLGVSDRALGLVGVTAPAVLGLVAVFYRWLNVSSFDPKYAVALGIPVSALSYGLMSAVTVTAVAGFEAVGAVLVIALIIVPGATAHLLARNLKGMLLVSVAHGVLSSWVGMYLAIALNISAAGAVVVVGGLLYAVAFVFAPGHGRLWLWRQRHRSSSRAPDGLSPSG
ncbi:iron ABC transporter [Lujinxingia litoralis]|uniref:Iron ABC transporter n=2 Tax=Lujinxingia litoralis TaxID=2211119 RepID=A0A328CAN7_9DELT|nr:iron ABC transporter [Lujinxingia litoralis]